MHDDTDIDMLVWSDLFRSLAKVLLLITSLMVGLWWLIHLGVAVMLAVIAGAAVIGFSWIALLTWRKRRRSSCLGTTMDDGAR